MTHTYLARLALLLFVSSLTAACFADPTTILERETVIVYEPAPSDAGPPGDAMGWNDSELPSMMKDSSGPPGSTSKSGGWSTTGVLHTRVGSVDLPESVQLQAVFPKAADYTVEFTIDRPATGAVNVIAEADITWTVEGNSVTRTVTVGNATSVTGTGQACKVIIRDKSIGPGPSLAYPVSVQVAPGTRGTNKQPPTLETNNGLIGQWNVAPAGFTIIPIPPNAGVISVFVTANNAPGSAALLPGDAEVAQQGPAATNKTYDPVAFNDWVPISSAATSIVLFNNRALGVIQYSVTFGIDG